MSEFTYDDFRKVAIEVADHISKWGDGKIRGDISIDSTWELKRYYASYLLMEFFTQHKAIEKSQSKQKKYTDLVSGYYDRSYLNIIREGKPIFANSPDSLLNDPEYLKSFFDQVLGNSFPTTINDQFKYFRPLTVFQLYYSAIGYHLHNVDVDALFRIDYVFMFTVSGLTSAISGFKKKGVGDIDRIFNSTRAIRQKWSPMDLKIKKVINAEKPQRKLSRNGRIQIYQKAWQKHFEGEKPPGRTKFHNYHNEHKND